MVEYSDRLATAMKDAGVKTQQLADALGLSYQAVKKVLDGKSSAFSAINNDNAARVLQVSPSWLATGQGPKRALVHTADAPSRTQGTGNFPEAQPVSQSIPTLSALAWEELMHRDRVPEWPAVVTVVVPDRALEPHVTRGDHLTFESTHEAEPTSVVVIELDDGSRWIRRLVRRADGSLWGATTSDAFPEFPATKILARAVRRSSAFSGF